MKKRIYSALTVSALILTTITGCNNKGNDSGNNTTTAATSESGTNNGAQTATTPLVVAYPEFSAKFSPFFAATSHDMDVVSMVSLPLASADRTGALVYGGIEGETREYNGKDYTYYGIADLAVNIDENAGITAYSIKLRDDIKFSDGETLDADDVIFSYYALSDTSYTGSSTLYSVPIVGMQSYRTQTAEEAYTEYSAIADAIYKAGRGYAPGDEDGFTSVQSERFWEHIKTEWETDLTEIKDYVAANYLSVADEYFPYSAEEISANDDIMTAFTMAIWGFGTINDDGTLAGVSTGKVWDLKESFPTMDELYSEAYGAYGGDPQAYASTESVSGRDIVGNATNAFISEFGRSEDNAEIKSISGIKKLSQTEIEVTTRGYDAAAEYQIFGINVAPLHYYGSAESYDYENGSYGFTRGDLSAVAAKTAKPMGGGPYVFDKYENKIVYFTANPNYYLGEPKTKLVQFKETAQADMISAVGTGAADISRPSGSVAETREIISYNANGETTGEVITTSAVDFLGYGYIGMNADTVRVGDNSQSPESKALRKGIATILASYRDLAIDSYFGDTAKVIDYPISSTSWAAPKKGESGYRTAYSLDVDGNEIFTDGMTADEKISAAEKAAVGYLTFAGYTADSSGAKLISAPDGATLSYEVIIPAGGAGDHPSFALLTAAKESLGNIGINLVINDPADSNVLWDKIDAGTHELWCAAWSVTVDPDMYQIYHSDNIRTSGSNRYHIADAALDEKIVAARTSADREYRKNVYRECLDIVLDWAVEVPIYQRQDFFVFSTERINTDTITPDITPYYGWMAEIQNIAMA